MPLVSQLVDVPGSLPSFQKPLGIASLLLSAGPGTGVVALPLPAHAAPRIRDLLVELITELSVLAMQKRRSKQTQSTKLHPRFLMGRLNMVEWILKTSYQVLDLLHYCNLYTIAMR